MTIERSHGKARTTMPRASDLGRIETVRDPSAGRGPAGRFAPGNRISVSSGDKHAMRKLLGVGAELTDPDAAIVAKDAQRALHAALRDLPHDGPIVRGLASLYGRHVALAGYATAMAERAGLATADGQLWVERATTHGVRAERLAVTMLAASKALAEAARAARPDDAHAAIAAAINEENSR